MGIGYTPEKIIKDFERKLRYEFPDLQDINLNKENKIITIDLWPYSNIGMNRLDKAVKKVIRTHFKGILKYVETGTWDEYDIDEDLWTEEDIIVKILV